MENPFSRPYESFRKAKNYLAELGYSSEEFLDFRLEVLGIQLQAVPLLKKSGPHPEKGGYPQEPPSSCGDMKAARMLLEDLCRCLERWKLAKPGEVASVMDSTLSPGEWVTRIRSRDYIFFEEHARGLEVSSSFLFFLAEEMARPMLASLNAKGGEGASSDSPRGSCPVCGHEPLLARILKEERKRILHCSLCTGSWPYPRLQCPFCEKQEGKVNFFFNRESDPFQVEVCNSCKRYLKTLFEDRLPGEIDPVALTELFHYATLEIDRIAQQEGYFRIPSTSKNFF